MAHRWDPRCIRPSGLVAPVAVDATGAGGPTRHQAAGPYWRQTSWGKYVPSGVDGSVVEQRIVEQAGRITSYGAVTGWAALRWHGATFFDGTSAGGDVELPVPLVVHSKLRPDPRSTHTEEQLSCTEWSEVDGLPVTTVPRALFDEVRRIDSVREKANAISMAAAARLISVQLFATYVARRGPWTGIQGARDAVRLAVDGCRSPQEFRMYLVWRLDAGLPMPVLNREVYDLDGNLIGIPDLLDVEAGLVGEYQGEDHKDGQRHREDVEREERFRDHGLEFFEVVGGGLARRQLVVDRMRKARARAKFLPPESRAWTLEPPPWRARPETVHEYLVRTGRADRLWRS
jgi:hypothetical protein